MTATLRQLLVQRAARLQERSALSAPEWGVLDYFQFRNRVEGVALGLMAAPLPEKGFFAHTNTPWDWMCEVAAACCGLPWNSAGQTVDASILGGSRFNDENGRQTYHDREDAVCESSPFCGDLSQGEYLRRLQRLNERLGWDHTTLIDVPLSALGTPEGRGALWSALFAGAHARLVLPQSRTKSVLGFFERTEEAKPWDGALFQCLWLE